MKGGQAHHRRVGKASTNRIKHAQWFNLTAIRLLVDCNGGVNVGAVLFPVLDMVIDLDVIDVGSTPRVLTRIREALFHALLGQNPAQTQLCVGLLRALFVYNRVALLVQFVDVVPPEMLLV